MIRAGWIAAACVTMAVSAAPPGWAGEPGNEPDPVYRYRNLAPLDGQVPPPRRGVEIDVRPAAAAERIARRETRVETTIRYRPGAVRVGYYGAPRRYYGPPRRWRGGYGRRVYRGPCVRRVVRYTPWGKVIRVVNRCGPYRRYPRYAPYHPHGPLY